MRTILFAALIAASVPVQAEVVTWTLDNVTFSDGGVATGAFSLDHDTGVTDGSVEITAGPVALHTAYHPYTGGIGFSDFNVDGLHSLRAAFGASGYGQFSLILNTDANFAEDTEGTFQVLTTSAEEQRLIEVIGGDPHYTTVYRTVLPGGELIAGGTLSAAVTQVPEMSTLAVAGLGLGLLAFVRARRLH